VIVHDEAQWPVEEVFDEFAEPGFAADETLGTADYVVPVGEEAGDVRGRVGGYVEDVPYVFGESEGGPLERDAERGSVRWDGDVDFADFLTLLKLGDTNSRG
jgi:hypothetical protein